MQKLESAIQAKATSVELLSLLQEEILEVDEFVQLLKRSLEASIRLEVKRNDCFPSHLEESHLIEQYFNELKLLETIGINELYLLLKKEVLTEWDEEEMVAYFLNLPAEITLGYPHKTLLFLDMVQEGTLGLLEGIRHFYQFREVEIEYLLTLFVAKKIIDFQTVCRLEEGAVEKIEEEFLTLVKKREQGCLSNADKERWIQLQQLTKDEEHLEVPELTKALLELDGRARAIVASRLGLFQEVESMETLADRYHLSEAELEQEFEVALEQLKKYLIEHGDLNAIETIFE